MSAAAVATSPSILHLGGPRSTAASGLLKSLAKEIGTEHILTSTTEASKATHKKSITVAFLRMRAQLEWSDEETSKRHLLIQTPTPSHPDNASTFTAPPEPPSHLPPRPVSNSMENVVELSRKPFTIQLSSIWRKT